MHTLRAPHRLTPLTGEFRPMRPEDEHPERGRAPKRKTCAPIEGPRPTLLTPNSAKQRNDVVTSDKKISSNRMNARKSSGPKSAEGKRRAAGNALRHGLAIPVGSIPELETDIKTLAESIALASGAATITEPALAAAEAQIDILRIRRARASLRSADIEGDLLTARLAALDRYERRAISRRKNAIMNLERNKK